jgi:hypothetical protein
LCTIRTNAGSPGSNVDGLLGTTALGLLDDPDLGDLDRAAEPVRVTICNSPDPADAETYATPRSVFHDVFEALSPASPRCPGWRRTVRQRCRDRSGQAGWRHEREEAKR